MLDENRGPLVGNISGVEICLAEYNTTTGYFTKLSITINLPISVSL